MSNSQIRSLFDTAVQAVTRDTHPVIAGDIAPAEYKSGRLVLPDSLSDRERICAALTAILHRANRGRRGYVIARCKVEAELLYSHMSEDDIAFVLKLFNERTDKVLF